MPKPSAVDELNPEPPERRRDFIAEPPEAEHPVYPRACAAKPATSAARRAKTAERSAK